VLVALLVAVEPVARAADSECDQNDPALCAVPLAQGQPAPFSGQLLTAKLAISLGQKADSFDARLQIELDRVNGEWQLKLKYEQDVHRIDNESKDKQIDRLNQALEKASIRPWYEHPGFIVTITIVATVLVFVGTAYLIQAVTK
jgi:hypothetical protein